MKNISIFLIKTYQKIPLSSHYNCKYIPTCSNYAIEAITTYGTVKGWYLTIKRILRCNPLSKGGYDPVIKEEKKMKKNNIIKLILVIITICSLCTGCFKRDDMEDINIITTVYPLEYVLTKLYGENSIINSIYPDGINVEEYKLTSKEYKDLVKKDLFVYNGSTNDKDVALNLVNKNKNILIMDSNLGMELQYDIEELWLDPSNLLMISQNIKNGLEELIDNKYIKNELKKAYDELKVELSELDADFKTLSEQANNKTIIVSSDALSFLAKYNFNVININKGDKELKEAIKLINNKDVNYLYVLENEEETTALKKVKNETKVEVITIDKVDNLTDEQRDNKKNYISLMKENIELFRKGTQ